MPSVTATKAEAPLILTIDAGTSSARALLFDARGRAVEGLAAQERYSIRSGPDGAVEDDPDAALERIWRCVDGALAQAGPLAEQIRAVAVDTLVSNILAIDAAGRPLTPLITYADTRNDADADRAAPHPRRARGPPAHRLPAAHQLLAGAAGLVSPHAAGYLARGGALDHARRVPGAAPVRAVPRQLLGGLVERAARPAAG